MKITIRAIGVFALIISSSAISQSRWVTGPLVDISELDIASVQIGMPSEEAFAAATEFLEVDRQYLALNGHYYHPVLKKEIASSATIDSVPTTNPAAKNFEGWRLVISLVPSIPYGDEVELVVGSVMYLVPSSDENAELMKNAAVEKFGKPTIDTDGVPTQWCEEASTPLAVCSGGRYVTLDGTWLTIVSDLADIEENERQNAKVKPKF